MTMNRKLIIFGNGGLASVVRFYCEKLGIKIAGFTLDNEYLNSDTFEGLPNINFKNLINYFPPSDYLLFIAIGASDMLGLARREKMQNGLDMGYELFSHIFVDDDLKKKISLGKNTFIMPGCSVDPFVKFGHGIIAWNGSIICHHTTVGDYCFIAPGATICGKVTICEHCFIGSNSTIRDNTILAPRTLVGAGSTITHNTESAGIYVPSRSKNIN